MTSTDGAVSAVDGGGPERLMRAKDVTGLPVVTITGGDDIAEIKDVVYDAGSHSLIGFTLNKRGWFRGNLRGVLAATDIEGIGADAVMVLDEGALTTSDQPVAALVEPETQRDVMGNRVLSSDGTDLGQITGVVLSTGADPAAVGYELTGAAGEDLFVPISAQMAISDTNLILPAESTPFVRNDLAGFGASIASYRADLDRASERVDPADHWEQP
jgi:uncharacterized protein YrrD